MNNTQNWIDNILSDLSVGAADVRVLILGGLSIWLIVLGVQWIISILKPAGVSIGGQDD